MNVFFDLPESQQLILCKDWLKLRDLNALDTAVCCRKYRSDYLNLLASPLCTFAAYERAYIDLQIKWLVRRRLKFQEVGLYSLILEEQMLCCSFLEMTGKSIRILHLHTAFDPDHDMEGECDLFIYWENLMCCIAVNCPNLQEFAVSNRSEPVHYNTSLILLITRCTHLRVLQLQHGRNISNAILAAIISAPKLVEVDLSACDLDSFSGFISPTLVSNSVTDLYCEETVLDGESLSNLFAHFPRVSTFTSSAVTAADFVSIANTCRYVTNATVYVTETISVPDMTEVARCWPHLQQMQIYSTEGVSCAEQAWVGLVQLCPLLTVAKFCIHSVCTSDGWVRRSKCVYPVEYKGSRLYELCVESMSENALRSIIQHCPYLHILAILHHQPYAIPKTLLNSSVDTVRPAELALQYVSNSSIQVLYLSNFTRLSDKLVRKLHNIEQLYVSNAGRHLTNECISELSTRCPGLKALRLRACLAITDRFVLPLLEACPELVLLELYKNATDVSSEKSRGMSMLKALVHKKYPSIRCFEVNS